MKLGLLTTLTVGACVLAIPAQAVDYVQCREMLRTRNQMVEKAARAELYFKDKLIGDECDDSKFQVVSIPSKKIGSIWTQTLYRTDYEAKRACEKERDSRIEATLLKTQKPYIDKDGAKIWSAEGINWAKAYDKVDNDMEAEGCPYQ